MKKRIRILAVFSIPLILIPIFLDLIFFSWHSSLDFGNLDSWIGFFGSFYGGTISGLITFLGVWLTLKKQDNEKFINTYFERKLIIDTFLGEINRFIDQINNTAENEKKLESLLLFKAKFMNFVDNGNLLKVEGKIAIKIFPLYEQYLKIWKYEKTILKDEEKTVIQYYFSIVLNLKILLNNYNNYLQKESQRIEKFFI